MGFYIWTMILVLAHIFLILFLLRIISLQFAPIQVPFLAFKQILIFVNNLILNYIRQAMDRHGASEQANFKKFASTPFAPVVLFPSKRNGAGRGACEHIVLTLLLVLLIRRVHNPP